MRARNIMMGLLGTASCLSIIASPVSAQEQEEEFLGTIELGQSKREIQTDTAVPVTNIDQEEINDRQASTVAELIDSVPGVTLVNGTNPQGSGINIRGFGANGTYGTDQKVLIQIDGATTGSEELYRIGNQLYTDPELYKSVSVIRGTVGSFEFGSGVIGGVVRLETKDASDFTGGEPGFKFRQTFGGNTNGEGFLSSTILAWQPTKNWEFLLNYTYRDQDDYKNGDGSVISDTKFKMPSFLAKGKYTFGESDDHSLTLSYNKSTTDEKDVPYDTFAGGATGFANVDRKTESEITGLRYRYSPVANDLVDLDVNLTYSDQLIDISPLTPGGSPLYTAQHRYETTKLTVKNTAYFDTGAMSHNLRAGFEVRERKRQTAFAAPGGTDKRFALFVVDDIEVTEQFTLSPALRYENQDITGDQASVDPLNRSYSNNALMGGLSARYEFNNGIAVFGSGAYTESLPILDDFGSIAFMTQPEKAQTFEVGASYNANDIFSDGDTVRAKVNFYTSNIWDVTSYSGVANVDNKGAEIEASYAHASGFYSDLNMNITEGTETTTAGVKQGWRNSPEDSLRLTVGKRLSAAWDVSWELVAGLNSERQVRSQSGVSYQPVSGYGLNNLRVTYIPQEGLFADTEIRFGVENIFDKQYRTKLSTRDAPGRNFKLTLAKTF